VVTLVHAELPEVLEADPESWMCWAVVELVGGGRWEVRRWITTDTAPSAEGPVFLALALGLPEPVGFSFPRRFGDLLDGLEQQRVDIVRLTQMLRFTLEANNRRYPPDPETGAGPPLLVFVVSPAPPGSAAPSRVAYLAAWLLDMPSLVSGTLTARDPVWWVPVLDQRPRFTTRRDVRRPVSWLRGRRVLLLGCGGLGAPIAEFCVRAGAADLHVVDDGAVLPGILVRQPYADADFGRSKVEALSERLEGIRSGTKITMTYGDAVSYLLNGYDRELDLIIDATAARTVAAALERSRWEDNRPQPPLLSVMVGHDSARGVATLALRGAGGAGADILRKLAVTAAGDDSLLDVLDDFYPDLPRTELFLPEPGCSDPTYVGSAADLASFSAWLLNDALTILGVERHDAQPLRWATVLRTPAAGRPGPTSENRHWPEDVVRVDAVEGYQVRMSPSAFAEVRNDVIRMAGTRGPYVETGGLLLGQIDHASRVVWVTEAQGLPPGSEAFTEKLRLDPGAARAAVEERLLLTRQLVGFIGAWHTHPRDAAEPSAIDLHAIREMAAGTGTAALLVIFGGGDRDRWHRWTGGRGRPDWYAGLFFPN
jgi:integrative and conjugative element protein (TIGR02256 family)